MKHTRLESPNMRRLIERGLVSRKCCAILPHCEAAEKSIGIVSRDPRIAEKSTVVYPAVDLDMVHLPPAKRDEKPHVLFIGEYLWKGGREVIDACLRLSSRLDFRLTYVSIRVHPPEDVIKRAHELMDIEYVRGPMPRRELFEKVYPSVDIFIMPTYLDTFGYAYLEAMAFGLPCIGTNHFAVPEIIDSERTGIIVEAPITYFDSTGKGHPELSVESVDARKTVDSLCEALSRLIESKTLRERMGAEGRRAMVDGKFSIERRNGILKAAYESCLRR
jgi:glycosyltransferase involved in cell wall biosynthesis